MTRNGGIMPKQQTQQTQPDKKKKRNWNLLFARVKVVDKIFFVQNLAVLVKAGFSLAQALETVARQTKEKWLKEIISTVAADVEAGQTFADALRKYEKIFDPLFVNMIETGEVSGKLEQTLRELALQLKKSHELFLKVRNALAYPAVILVAMIGVGTAMMIFVIPKIVEIYKDSSGTLPLPTRIVIAVSDFVTNNGIITVIVAGIILVAIYLLQRNEQVKLRLHRVYVRLPIFGGIIQEYNLARFSRVFHSLISTDIPIIRAFQIMTNTMGNRAYRKHIAEAIPQLERGVPIGQILSADEVLFPPTVAEMITVAEQSGAMDDMTKDISDHYEQEVSSALDGLAVLIEPVLMLFLGGAVGIIAVAILLPLYNLVDLT